MSDATGPSHTHQAYEGELIPRSTLDFLTFLVGGPGSMAMGVLTTFMLMLYASGERTIAAWVMFGGLAAYFLVLFTLWGFQVRHRN